MLTSVMSVGLSVDYIAHVTYHYLAARAATQEARLHKAMHHVAVPACQSAFSTILGVATLGKMIFVDILKFLQLYYCNLWVVLIYTLKYQKLISLFDYTA